MNLEDFLKTDEGKKITPKEFIKLMNVIVNELHVQTINGFSITENIMVEILENQKRSKKFTLRDLNSINYCIAKNKDKGKKIQHLNEFMKKIISNTDDSNHLRSLQEISNLIISTDKTANFMNFEYFRLKINKLYQVFKKDPLIVRRDVNVRDFKVCIYCNQMSYQIMYKLNDCDCHLHIKCLERNVYEYIEFLNSNQSETYEINSCEDRKNHLSLLDLSEITKKKSSIFPLSNTVYKIIFYYFLNPELEKRLCGSTDCKNDHHILNKEKKPYKISCNEEICSFCGKDYHDICLEYEESIRFN